ncbi:cystathionine beta-lyase [Bacillus sp. FJAT-27231]|uniref:MalY/PatB family protein n=1 Tax=Bacillus sp. FJAT-27231 TaxID=1679168 RepID=UPI0006708B38|nr:MalY/PatB family protein [Bacillus sp. FJAT-27231]KMY55150.1 cystathionine beta-lyase [Bacillus sp. FJAT-27231]
MSRFDRVINRTGTNAVKWDNIKAVFGVEDALPMWVADMDFEAPDAVKEAVIKQAEHGIYGYTVIPDSTREAIKNWMAERHNWQIETNWLLFHHGVVPSLGTAIEAFTDLGDSVLLQSPVYTPFFDMIERNGRLVVNSELVLRNDRYEIDFADLEEKLSRKEVKLFLLCSPHNPGGRVWTKEELTIIAELCQKHNVLIVSDEIHSDLTAEPHKHIPIASIQEQFQSTVVTCIAPSKTFNLAGLQSSAMIVPNRELRAKLQKVLAKQGFFTLNMMGIAAMEAAYREGGPWLDEVINYIRGNARLVKEFIDRELPELTAIEPEGSYLVWIDCRKLGLSDEELMKKLLLKGKLALGQGSKYRSGGEGFVRMNVACPRSLVEDGLQRLKTSLSETD